MENLAPFQGRVDAFATTYQPTGYQMIESFKIRNFRSFDDVEVRNVRRINVIVGENGSGKTALLEAVFLAIGPSPEIALRTRMWRGTDQIQIGGATREQIDMALWSDLFHRFDVKKNAVISLEGKGSNRSITVSFKHTDKTVTFGKNKSPAFLVEEAVPVTFKWKLQGGREVKLVPRIEDNQLKIPPGPDTDIPGVFIAATRPISALELATRFSQLNRTFKAKQFTDLFYEQFKTLTDLSVEVGGGGPMLHATVSGLPEKIPLTLASGGMNKLAFILLSIPVVPGGVVIVDEIESGIYYKRLPAVWESVLKLAEAYDVQIFASTHSIECLDAAADVAEKAPEKFSVMRVVSKAGASVIRQFDGERFIDAMEENIEVR